MTTIYLSSTYEDLKEYRKVVFDDLRKAGYNVIAMEDYVAADKRPVEKCLADVARADTYVGLFAFRYGYVPPPEHGNPDSFSITELEFRHAEKLGKLCLTFAVSEDTPWPPKFIDGLKGEPINRLREYLLTEKTASFFSSPHQLASLVQAAVTKHLEESKQADTPGAKKTEPPHPIIWDIQKNGSPYPGLMHFTRKYAPVFFGREAEVREILDRMVLPGGRFIIISGGSGTGKSSLVDAGVLPRIEDGGFPGVGKCLCVRMVSSQGSHPFDALTRVLHSEIEQARLNPFTLGQELLVQPAMFAERMDQIIKGASVDALVVFVDQMEELFTAQGKDHTKVYLSALYGAAHESRLRVIATIRSDFLHHCHEHEDMLKVLKGRGHYPLGPVEQFMLRDMIVKPAQCAGLTVPDKLLDRLSRDAELGSLPLLAFVLEKLFYRRVDQVLSEAVYDSLKGIAGAIGDHVREVEAEITEKFDDKSSECLAKIFPPLVVVNVDGQPTRRRMLKTSLGEEIRPIVDILIGKRLLSTEGEGEAAIVSIAHEKLFEVWPALARWIGENRDDYLILNQARMEAHEWQKHRYDIKYLWHVERLKRLQEIIQRLGHDVDAAVKQYCSPQDQLIKRLDDASLSHQERLTIGNYLAALDDTQPGVGLKDGIPDIDWVNIPAGQVKLELVKGVFKVKAFRISRYPVTNIQFEAFIKADDGYSNEQWWRDMESGAPALSNWPEDNCPRTDVSWYEAVAFCHWLTKRLGSTIRLPAEWEWQQAATGGYAQREYPWAGGWNPALCNSDESRLNRSTAVSVYPNGATLQAVLDMAGNVWEWCLNKYEKPGDRSAALVDKSGNGRVLRGGSWGSSAWNLRSSLRHWQDPKFRNYSIGFRLVQDIGRRSNSSNRSAFKT